MFRFVVSLVADERCLERESALLAAAGRSNKQIAEKLFVSVRTVENRLQHVYGKLGIPGRAALGEALAS